jgi:hypothetical protein
MIFERPATWKLAFDEPLRKAQAALSKLPSQTTSGSEH